MNYQKLYAEQLKEIDFLNHMLNGLYEALGPANDDIWLEVKNSYRKEIPDGY